MPTCSASQAKSWLALLAILIPIVAVPTIPQEGTTRAVIKVIGVTQVIDPSSLKKASAAVGTPDGGFFISGGYRKDDYGKGDLTRLWYLKISSSASVEWERTTQSDWVNGFPESVYLQTYGGYWAVSTHYVKDWEAEFKKQRASGINWVTLLNANAYDVVLPYDGTGTAAPEIRVSEVGKSEHVSCGAEMKDGFVLTGWTISSASPNAIPLIEKVDRAGRLQWKREFPEHHGQSVDVSDQIGQRICGGLHLGAGGSITLVFNVRVLPITHTRDEWVKAVSSPATNHKGVLVLKLDANGKDVSQIRHDDTTDGFLLSDEKGLLLVERKAPVYPAQGSMPIAEALEQIKRISDTGYGVRFIRLDGSLQHVTNVSEYVPGALENLRAVYRTPEGGFLLAGCPVNGGDNYVVHIDSLGHLSSVLQLSAPQRIQQCSSFTFNSGARRGEALVWVSNDIVGSWVFTLQYPN
jgi:hypothetical protein